MRTCFYPVTWRVGGGKGKVSKEGGGGPVAPEQAAYGKGGNDAFEDGGVAPCRDDAVGGGVVVGFWEVRGDRIGGPPVEKGAGGGISDVVCCESNEGCANTDRGRGQGRRSKKR